MPRIVADGNIPFVAEAFGALGEVVTLPSSAIDAEAVRDADLVLVRSTVRVDERLLGGSRARFVATATIGTDHLDTAWLDARGITWAAAPGSNAPSVAQWFAAALLELVARPGVTRPVRAGIVGLGNVGLRVVRVLSALGIDCLVCDPPRQRAGDGGSGLAERAVPLEVVLAECDLITLHVPLTDEGPERTRGLIDAARIAAMRPGAWLVNSSRGAVLDGRAAAEARRAGHLGALVLDVFDPEPAVPTGVVSACDRATTHIAGHSLDGKAAGTEMILRAACAFLGVAPRWSARDALDPVEPGRVVIDPARSNDEAAREVVAAHYRINQDDAALRAIAAIADPSTRGASFRRYRDTYPVRREPRGARFVVEQPRAAALAVTLGGVVDRA